MNIYFIGMSISLIIYVILGILISRNVKDANDFYVAGRRAPLILVAGSMVASYTSTGMFMGDAAQCYDGAFSSIIVFAGMQSAGYILGSVFFGRYLRRAGVFTIPEFFGKRFNSKAMRILAASTAIIMMSVYLLSVLQGIGTLMASVIGIDYRVCITLALLAFSFITITSGSSGVLITDTIMASIFTCSIIVAALFIATKGGGWFASIAAVSNNDMTRDFLSWSGKPGALYNTGVENMIWGFTYGIVWMSVCMVGPWQSSRYLMAKDEHTVVRSGAIAALGVFILEFLAGMAAVMVSIFNPYLDDSSQVLIWASMNLLPKLLGVILLTGVLSAGISSATTFLSLIGASVANDIMQKHKDDSENYVSIKAGQITMVVVSVIIWILAIFNPPSIFWIMFLGGAVAASSWMPVAIASVFSKRVTKSAAFCGMFFGFIGCFVTRLVSSIGGISLPVYFDPSIIGILCNVISLVLVSCFTKPNVAEENARNAFLIIPETEMNKDAVRVTLNWAKMSMLVGVVIVLLLLFLWVIPYTYA